MKTYALSCLSLFTYLIIIILIGGSLGPITSSIAQDFNGYTYHNSRDKRSKRTISSLVLPNLNQILAPTLQKEFVTVVVTPASSPAPNPEPQATTTQPIQPIQPTQSAVRNRFGFGSSDPNRPIDSADSQRVGLPLPTPTNPNIAATPLQLQIQPQATPPTFDTQPKQLTQHPQPQMQVQVDQQVDHGHPFTHQHQPRYYFYKSPYYGGGGCGVFSGGQSFRSPYSGIRSHRSSSRSFFSGSSRFRSGSRIKRYR